MGNRHYIKSFGVAVLLSLFTIAVSAQQTLRTGYFLKGNPYRFRMNPALAGDCNYIALPVFGNFNFNTAGNVGLGNFVYKSSNNNDLVTFMHPSVGANEFLEELESEIVTSADIDVTLLSAGFTAFGGYNTVDIGFHSRTDINVPYSMFEFMKVMGSNDYAIRDVAFATNNYVDIAVGHSHKVTSDITVGARLKLLLGLGYAGVMFDRMDISMNGDRWTINAQGTASVAMGGAFTKEPGNNSVVDGYDDAALGVNGVGAGIDLGVEYDLSNVLVEGLVVSASLNDLGFMNWSGVAKAGISHDSPFVFEGFKNVAIHDDVPGTNIEDQFDGLKNDLEEFFALEDMGESSESRMLSATLNVGVEYSMPFYKNFSIGALYTSRFDEVLPLHQFSLMANVAPLKWLDLAVSGTVSNMGTGFGAMANVHLTGFNLFIGTDCFMGKVSKQFIPLDNMNSSISFGINIPFGKQR